MKWNEEIRARRKALRITREHLADLAGLSLATVARVEHGCRCSEKTLEAIYKALENQELYQGAPQESTEQIEQFISALLYVDLVGNIGAYLSEGNEGLYTTLARRARKIARYFTKTKEE